ncbi:MAG: hypothetical protein GY866_03585 [Proteobacteria bacterium]|nr:hypothetical protein [Pseudomonadota bacterium]
MGIFLERFSSATADFVSHEDRLEIKLHVSNFHHQKGGAHTAYVSVYSDGVGKYQNISERMSPFFTVFSACSIISV